MFRAVGDHVRGRQRVGIVLTLLLFFSCFPLKALANCLPQIGIDRVEQELQGQPLNKVLRVLLGEDALQNIIFDGVSKQLTVEVATEGYRKRTVFEHIMRIHNLYCIFDGKFNISHSTDYKFSVSIQIYNSNLYALAAIVETEDNPMVRVKVMEGLNALILEGPREEVLPLMERIRRADAKNFAR